MDLIKSIKQSIEIIRLHNSVIENVAKHKSATNAGILILILGGIIAGLMGNESVLLMIFLTPIITLIFSFIGVGVLHGLAKLFKGKATFMELYRVLTHASIINWLVVFSNIPILNMIIPIATGVWGLVVNFTAIKKLYKLSTGKAVLVMVIPMVAAMILTIIGMSIYLYFNPGGLSTLSQ